MRLSQALLVACAASCGATSATPYEAPPSAFFENRVAAAAAEYEERLKTCEPKDRTLFLVESGMAHFVGGDAKMASARLREAASRMGILYGINQEQALTAWGVETDKEFKGEPYEQTLCSFYEGCAWMELGRFDRARAALLASQLADRSESSRSDFVPALTMHAIACIADGRRDLAVRDLERVRELQPSAEPLVDRLLGGDWNTVFLVDAGRGPSKTNSGPFRRGLGTIQQWSPVVAMTVDADGTRVSLVETCWTFRLSKEQGPRVVDRINQAEYQTHGSIEGMGLSLVHKAGTEFAGTVAEGTLAGAGALLMVTSQFLRVDVDTRGWSTIPERIFLGVGMLEPGSVELSVVPSDKNGIEVADQTQVWEGVPVTDGVQLLHFRCLARRSGGSWERDRWGSPLASESLAQP